MDIIKAKAETLTRRINKVAHSLAEQCDNAEALEVQTADIVGYAQEKMPVLADNIDVHMMMDDFAYVRNVLRENTECARTMLEHVSGNMLDEEDNVTPGMLAAFSELNKSIAENMRLYISSYKDLSAALSNMKAKSEVTNNLNIINPGTNVASVKDIIEKLKGTK